MKATATTTITAVSPATRREELRGRRRDVADGSVTIVPKTEGIILKADPFTSVGEGVRLELQEARLNDAQNIRFSGTAYRLRHSQVVDIADRLKRSQEQGVRHVGRAMVGESIKTKVIPAATLETVTKSADACEMVEQFSVEVIAAQPEANPV